MAGARPATLLESVLGVEKAKECEAEIQNRIHPEDESHIREELIESILARHIRKHKPKIREILQLLPSGKAKVIYDDAFQVLLSKVFTDVVVNYRVASDKVGNVYHRHEISRLPFHFHLLRYHFHKFS